MVLLGLRWSDIAPAAAPLVDVFEVNGWTTEESLPPAPRLLHNLDLDFSLSLPRVVSPTWLARCADAVARCASPWFSLHLGFSAERVRFDDGMLPLSPVLDRDDCFTRLVDALSRVKQHLSVPLLIENLDYNPGGAYEHICDPTFIAAAAGRLDCGLLLDLAHLQVSSDWLGLTPEEYLERLPLDRVVEVHLSGPRRINGRLDDRHEPLLDADYALLRRVLDSCQPQVVVLEYSRDSARLNEQLDRLRRLLDGKCSMV